MKKLLFIALTLCLLIPATYEASTGNLSTSTEFAVQKQKKKNSSKKRKSEKNYSQSKGCTYQGHKLIRGERGGCYYLSGNSKEYVDRGYCSGCN